MTSFNLETDLLNEPVLNIRVLRENLPDTAKAKELLLRFKPLLIRELEGIRRKLAKNELDKIRLHTHRIRTGGLYLGIESVSFPAAELERLIDAKAGENAIQRAWHLLYEACQRYLKQDADTLFALLDETAA